MKISFSTISLAFSSLLISMSTHSATELWSLDGFLNPESALYDSERDVIYVSNVNGGPADKDGAGHISRMTKDGKMQDPEWVTGLNAPKGLVQFENQLYVSDIDQLIAIDVDTGEVSGSWNADGAEFLNDLAVDEEGNVYVSDMMTNSIYQFDGDKLSLWLQDEALQHPNGLQVDGSRLLVAAWGKDIQEDFSTKVPGHLIAVELSDKSIAAVGSGEPVGNLDGLESDGEGNWLVSDWMAGVLYQIEPTGKANPLMELGQGSADLGVINSEALVLMPMMMDNKVIGISTR